MLYKAAQEFRKSGSKIFKPMKLFSIDKVFRNETLDATHLAEFFQIEGKIFLKIFFLIKQKLLIIIK